MKCLDSVFFFHCGELDWIWWGWQGRDSGSKEEMYNRKTSYNYLKNMSLDDVVLLSDLALEVKVQDDIRIEDRLLCYRYQSTFHLSSGG